MKKRVDNYKNFDEFKKLADLEFFPLFNEKVKEAFNNSEKIKEINNKKNITFIFLGVLIFFSLISIILLFTNNFIGFIAILLISLIISFIFFFFWRIYQKEKEKLLNSILKNIPIKELYTEAFKKLEPSIKYFGFISEQEEQFREVFITKKEVELYRNNVNYNATIFDISEPQFLLIRDKFPVSFVNVIYLLREYNRKGEYVDRFFHKGILKISTKKLEEKSFVFSLLKGGNIFSKKSKVKLENENFNKIFKPITNDELKIRQMYTPLSMELSLKRIKDMRGVKATNLWITSDSNNIYYEYSIDFNFMILDYKKSKLDSEKIISELYQDFLIDIYTLYYLISIMYITNYLD
ncbi:hypothetical protein [Mesomycoplasma molare]|uniref:DUF3137 domain-containing protein n=1 Tax=Mesomycoplasma molare TaxID=171288 RepID=A0ABY5TT89_9BACT|nr:hypothetical protein [Mesomycoplasma molare]UWD33883.1 hypothetical protein NX772_02110 [Mesomycoplasma molare]